MKATLLLACTFFFSCQKENTTSSEQPSLVIANSVEQILNDMKFCHEAIPHGVPESFDWQKCPRIGYGNNPGNLSAMIPWGQVYEDLAGSKSTNTRVPIRNIRTYYLSKRENTWKLWSGTKSVEGSHYLEDFKDNINVPAKNKRAENSGGISIKMIPDYNYHFWTPQDRVIIDPTDVAGVWSVVEARLVIDDNKKKDDRSEAKFLMSVGADYWLSKTADWTSNGDIGIGRFRYITSDWQSYNMHIMTESDLRNNPPPFDMNF